MFSIKSKYILEKPIHKIDFIKYCPSSLATVSNANSNISISLPRENAYICLQLSYISLEFEVLKNNNTRYADCDQTSLANFGPIALFSEAKLVTSSRKHLEKVDNLHTISLMYKLLTRTQQTSQLMYGFEKSSTIRRQEQTNSKTEKGTFFVRIKLKDLLGFADQEKITYGLGDTLTLKRKNKNDVIIRGAAVDVAKADVKDISWYIPHYVPNLENEQLVHNQILNKDPTELYYTERTVFRKDVNTNNNWTLELGNSGESTPTFVNVGFQARNIIDSQTHVNATFDRLSISKTSQTIRLEFKFNHQFGVADYIAYAVVLTPKLISISSDGQRHFDLLYYLYIFDIYIFKRCAQSLIRFKSC